MSRVRGVAAAKARSQQRPKALRAAAAGQIGRTVQAVHQSGRENIDAMTVKRTGLLRRWYQKALRKGGTVGLVGYVTAAARSAAFYARFVHDGTRFARARPYHERAVAEHSDEHAAGMRKALHDVLASAGPSGLARSGRGKEGGL